MSWNIVKTIDKSKWVRGPWDDEPDRVEFRCLGLPCLVARGPGGHFCGYVGVWRGHPLYGRGLDGISAVQSGHGGVSYACPAKGKFYGMARAPGDRDAPIWLLGFDCNHLGDLSWMDGDPATFFRRACIGVNIYRDIGYVTRAVKDLARELVNGRRRFGRKAAARESWGRSNRIHAPKPRHLGPGDPVEARKVSRRRLQRAVERFKESLDQDELAAWEATERATRALIDEAEARRGPVS